MIFTPDLAEKILSGEKTQTRRRRTGANPTNARGGWVDDPCRYKVGRTYAVQPGRGQKAIARIRILSVTAEAMCDMTEADALAEGFADRQGFVDWWLERYGRGSWLDPVWRITFALASSSPPTSPREGEL